MDYGRVAYEAYIAVRGVDGAGMPFPAWVTLHPAVQLAWRLAAEKVRAA